jgi:hypothetical protein
LFIDLLRECLFFGNLALLHRNPFTVGELQDIAFIQFRLVYVFRRTLLRPASNADREHVSGTIQETQCHLFNTIVGGDGRAPRHRVTGEYDQIFLS